MRRGAPRHLQLDAAGEALELAARLRPRPPERVVGRGCRAYDPTRARLTLERDQIHAHLARASAHPRARVTCAPHAGGAWRRRASAPFPISSRDRTTTEGET